MACVSSSRARKVLLLAVAAILAGAASVEARWRDCGQPLTTGPSPTTTDALSILRSAVGIAGACELEPCVCDVSGDAKLTTADAIRALKLAVGQSVVTSCGCAEKAACDRATLTVEVGSEIDLGWTGIAHDSELPSGFSLDLTVVKRCGGDGAVCSANTDCEESVACEATCDCNHDASCELTSVTENRCLITYEPCSQNSDCGEFSSVCRELFAPPISISSGGTPVCWQMSLLDPLTGTADLASGEWTFATRVETRISLGIQLDMPCPSCGAASQNPSVGDSFFCEGGLAPGEECRVDATSPIFGGTSYDCPPQIAFSTGPNPFVLRFSDATSGEITRTAELPCSNFSFRSNPLNAPANPGKCLDNNSACTSNADCRRCTEDPTTTCTTDTQCTGKGSCAEAPDQPITCGFWCHCGFCNGNASLPCFETIDCPQGETCQVGPGTGSAQNAPQQKPNDCSNDQFLCGEVEPERCATTELGQCSEQPYRSCQSGSTTCEDNNAGLCIVESRPCFESRITRSGEASPIGGRCPGGSVCATNSDCDAGGECGDDAMSPESVALACMPGTSSSSINNVAGITGPATFRFRTRLDFHRD
jgi:hypothetical protein